MRLPLVGAALFALPLASAFAQDDDAQSDPAPPYRWIELGYGTQFAAAPGQNTERARHAFRLATNMEVAPHFHLCGSYTLARYRDETLDVIGGGIGAHAELRPDLHGIVQLTLESSTGASVTQDGVGVEAGVRWFTRAAEFGLTAKQSRLKADGGPFPGAEDRFVSVNLAGIMPLNEALSLTVRAERSTGSGDLSDDLDFDTYLVGVRFRL